MSEKEISPQRHQSATAKQSKTLRLAKSVSAFIFGIVVPLVLLISASTTITKIVEDMNADAKLSGSHSEIVQWLKEYDIQPNQGNKYAFTSYLIAQQTNEKVIKKKTLMKAVLMQLGLVIVSIGILFIVLGFKEGGLNGTAAGVAGIDFNITIGSTGLATIFLGVLMITLGGVISNKFTTVGVPNFAHGNNPTISKAQITEALENCRKNEALIIENNTSVFICVDNALTGLFKSTN